MVIIHQSGHHGPRSTTKVGVTGLSIKKQHAETRGQQDRASLVTIGMSTQTYAGEMKAPEPRKRTKQLPHQRAAPKSRVTYHHGPSQEHQNSSELQIARGTSDKLGSYEIDKLATDKTKA